MLTESLDDYQSRDDDALYSTLQLRSLCARLPLALEPYQASTFARTAMILWLQFGLNFAPCFFVLVLLFKFACYSDVMCYSAKLYTYSASAVSGQIHIQGGSKIVSCCTVSTAYFFEPPCKCVCVCVCACLVCRLAVHARPPRLAQISGRCLSHISLPSCRRRTTCRVDTYQMTVSPRPKSSVRPHADRKLRPIANFASTLSSFIA